ncbi:hypothetical protein GGR51DRAFT_208436 [Nemania sp. FL0031]|nr:hypothetical protein GGR51DRAFT_208436 [Nemania sp. FL0031]
MPRPPSNVDEFRNEITASYESGASVPTILDSIAKKGCNCTQRTLERRIASWNLNNRKGRARSDQILSRVQFLFFVRGCQDRSIQTDLKKAGISISLRTIKGIRLRNGMKRPKGRYQYDGNVLSDDVRIPTAYLALPTAYRCQAFVVIAGPPAPEQPYRTHATL